MKPTDAYPHPSDWQTSTVDKAVEVKRGVSWSKDQEHSTPRDGSVPVIRIGNVQKVLQLDDLIYISGLKANAVQNKRVTSGWSVMVGSNGNRSRVGNAVFIANDSDYLFASFLIAAQPRAESNILPSYFYRWLSSEPVQAYLSASSEGTTGLNNLSHSFFKAMTIPFPKAREQAGIVRILDAVDDAIKRAHEAVKSASDLRRGLLQSAFEFRTNNEPRKRTDAGMIPQSWDAVRGKQAFVLLSGGNSSVNALRRPRREDKIDAWFMKVDDFNLPANRRNITRTKIGFSTADNPMFSVLPLKTVIIAKRGAAILKNRVRTTRVAVALDPNLMGIQMLPGMLPDFFKYQLEWRNLPRYLEDSGIPQLNNKDLYPRYFLKAPLPQQEDIICRVSVAESYQDTLVSKLEALEDLKKSLMQDLLTGKVRAGNVDPEGMLTS